MSCAGCVRVFMIIFNFLFTLMGFALLAGGLYFFFTNPQVDGQGQQELSMLSYFLLGIAAIGCITLLLGILGCCGAFHYSRCILSFYFVLLLILFSAEIAVGVLAAQNREALKDTVDSVLSQTIQDGDNSPFIKIIESVFQCCGYASGSSAIRCSTKNLMQNGIDINRIVPVPCKERLATITENVYALFACLIALALVQLLGLVFASILCCAAKDRLEYTQYHPVYQ